MSSKENNSKRKNKLPIIFRIIDENLEVSKNTIIDISTDLPEDFIEEVTKRIELSLQKINNNPRLGVSKEEGAKIDYDRIKKIVGIRRSLFEQRLKWYTRYKNNHNKKIKTEAEYEKLLKEQLNENDVQKQMKISQKIKKLEERKLKLEDEKLKLEDMQKEGEEEMQDLEALRKLLA